MERNWELLALKDKGKRAMGWRTLKAFCEWYANEPSVHSSSLISIAATVATHQAFKCGHLRNH